MDHIEFTTRQLISLGEAAEGFLTRTPVRVSKTNLHDGTTVALEGKSKTGGHDDKVILVSKSGQRADLSAMDHFQQPHLSIGA